MEYLEAFDAEEQDKNYTMDGPLFLVCDTSYIKSFAF